MNKAEKILTGIFGTGIFVFLAYCITEGITGFGLAHGFEKGYLSIFGIILVLSCLGMFSVLVYHFMRKRKSSGKAFITKADKVWFILSFIPIALINVYGIISAFCGISFLWSMSYGIDAFLIAVLCGIALLFIIPVLPLCMTWQTIYIIRVIKAKRAAKRADAQ